MRFAPIVVISVLVATALVVPVLALPQPVDPVPTLASADPAVSGKWETPFDGGVPAVNMVLLKDGRVLYWSGVEADGRDNVFFTDYPVSGTSRIWDPATNTFSDTTPANGAGGDLFCSGATILKDGTIVTAGGSGWDSLPNSTKWALWAATWGDPQHADPWPVLWGTNDTRVFDPATNAWTKVADMSVGRWYPTLFTDSNGNAVVASGIGQLTNPLDHQTSLERWDGAAWNDMHASNLLPLYPRLFTVPSGDLRGQLFYETVGTLWGPFGERPDEATWSLEQRFDGHAWSTLGASAFGARQHAASVMLPLDPANGYQAQIVTFGGTLQRSVVATPASELTTIGLDGSIAHDVTGLLNHPRWHLNGVGLPDGSVLAVGGGLYDNVVAHGQPNAPVLAAEQFDPATGQWNERASMTVPRMYHSTAILLPSGKVLAGGHVPLPVPWSAARDNVQYESQIAETRLEVYDPPYLFWGPRPVIDTVLTPTAGYGADIAVSMVPGTPVVDKAVLVHPGATTHAWDSDQRTIVLHHTATYGDAYVFDAPPNGDVAPPGDWMLFLLHHVEGKGDVPSEAGWVHLG